LLLKPSPDKCPICAVKHEPHLPHNAQSLYYQYRFYGVRGRWPTWADACAHCTPEMIEFWKEKLALNWTEPENGEKPIADPPAESFHQCVGDITDTGFGLKFRGNSGYKLGYNKIWDCGQSLYIKD
jgi:hypothetical protein